MHRKQMILKVISSSFRQNNNSISMDEGTPIGHTSNEPEEDHPTLINGNTTSASHIQVGMELLLNILWTKEFKFNLKVADTASGAIIIWRVNYQCSLFNFSLENLPWMETTPVVLAVIVLQHLKGTVCIFN